MIGGLVALGAAAALLQGGGAMPPAEAPRIAFVHGDHVWTMAPDGSGRRHLVHGGGPAWSPDGAALAFHYGGGVHVIAADGSRERDLPGLGRDPAWSPDGSLIAIARRDAGGPLVTGVDVVRADGTQRRRVIERRSSTDLISSPTWFPGGERLACTRRRAIGGGDHAYEVRSVRLDGTDDRLFLADAKSVAFSPDGARIAIGDLRGAEGETCLAGECHPDADLAVAAADGSGRTVLLRTPSDEADPAWSADGSRIAFASGRNVPKAKFDHEEIYTVAPDGSCLTWLTNGTPRASPRRGRRTRVPRRPAGAVPPTGRR